MNRVEAAAMFEALLLLLRLCPVDDCLCQQSKQSAQLEAQPPWLPRNWPLVALDA